MMHFKEQAEDQGFLYKRWDAEVSPFKVQNGISRSHKQIVRWAKNTRMDKVCIAEDDLLFTSKKGWSYFISEMPDDFDLYLSGLSTGQVLSDNTVKDFSGLHLYFIHSRFYDHFLMLPEYNDIDRACAGAGRFVVCNPMVAIQRNDYSDHKSAYQDYTEIWKKYTFLAD